MEQLALSTSVKNFGFGLMTKYMLPLQISGFLLLAAMVGVIVLSKKEQGTKLKWKAFLSIICLSRYCYFRLVFLGLLKESSSYFNVAGTDA